MIKASVPKQYLPKAESTNVRYSLSGKYLLRYFVKRFDSFIFEVSSTDFNEYKNSPYFEKVIVTWYIRGTKEFIISQNRKEINLANQKLKGVKNLVVNLLELYQGEV